MTAVVNTEARETAALRTAHDNLAEIATMPWPHDPIPEILARVEALIVVCPLVEPESAAANQILAQLRRDSRVLAEVDSFGLLRGPIRTRYLAAIASVAL